MTKYVSELTWLDEPKPWRREICLLRFVHGAIAPSNAEMVVESGRPRRTVENWKKGDRWVEQRLLVKGAEIGKPVISRVSTEVSTAIAHVETQQSFAVPALPEVGVVGLAKEAKKEHLALYRKMRLNADMYFTFANHVIGAVQAGRIPNEQVLAGLNKFMQLSGKGNPTTAAIACAQAAIAGERQALGIDRLEDLDEMRAYLIKQGYDVVKLLDDGTVEPLESVDLPVENRG